MIFAFKNNFNYKEHLFFAIYRKYYTAKKVKKWDIYVCMYTHTQTHTHTHYSWYLRAIKPSIFMFLKY